MELVSPRMITSRFLKRIDKPGDAGYSTPDKAKGGDAKRPVCQGEIMPSQPATGRMPKFLSRVLLIVPSALVLLLLTLAVVGEAQTAKDPGPRGGAPGAGGFISGLTTAQQTMEAPGASFFTEVQLVAGGQAIKRVGLGPVFDANSCNGCHAGPANGGSSLGPNVTPVASGALCPDGTPIQTTAGNQLFMQYQGCGAVNTMPFFETQGGPTVVARMPYKPDLVTPDGHVHELFTITGRTDAGTCNIQQPDFDTAYAEGNLIFRNTTPFFGGGLIEIIQDSAIIANMTANLTEKMALGISGHPNINADDGSVNRFGWKAQKRSLILFAGEAYNVENGNSNEFFPNELNETPGCIPPFPDGPPNGNGTHGVPDDRADYAALPTPGYLTPGDPERFSIFGRFLAPPAPGQCVADPPETAAQTCSNGQTQFNSVGCVLCHTRSFVTPPSSVVAVGNQTANLYSDLLVHDMGPCDADNVTQGSATGDQFRTMPLWGVGQRYFFMHDGGLNRHGAPNKDIVQAIEDHSCTGNAQYPNSEANGVITNFNNLTPTNQQDLINFLRSL